MIKPELAGFFVQVAMVLSAGLLASGFAGKSLADPPASLSLEEFLQVRDLSSLAVSPDLRTLVVRVSHDDLASNRRVEAWWRVSLDGAQNATLIVDAGEGDLHQNGVFVGPVSLESPQWSSDSRWFYYRAIRKGQVQIWRTEAAGGATEQLTWDAADVTGFVLDKETGDILYKVGANRADIVAAEQAEYDSGVLLDDTLIVGAPIVRNHPVHGRLSTLRRVNGVGAVLGVAGLGNGNEQLKVLDSVTRRSTPASANQVAVYKQMERARPDPMHPPMEVHLHGGVVSVDAARGGLPSSDTRRRLVFKTGNALQPEMACEDIACTSTDSKLGFNADGSLNLVGYGEGAGVIFHKREFHGEGVYAWNPGKADVRTIAFTQGQLRGTSLGLGLGVCEPAGDEVFCVASDADRAPRLVAISLRSGVSRVLLDPNPLLGPDHLGRTERLVVETPDGSLTYGFLVLPRDHRLGERLPLVITDYSCDGFIRPEDDTSEHLLAAAGIAAFCLNDNADSKTSSDVSAALDAANKDRAIKAWHGPIMALSLAYRMALIQQLADRGIINPNRVALAGMSAGATQVTYALSRSDAFVAGLITTASYDDPMHYYLNGALSRLHRKDASGQPISIDDYLAPVSSVPHARDIEPLLMQVPDREYITNMQLYSAMVAHDRPVEMIVYPDEFHIKSQPRHRLSAYSRSTDWFRFWLQGYEDPAPTKQAQYARWRTLREKRDAAAGMMAPATSSSSREL